MKVDYSSSNLISFDWNFEFVSRFYFFFSSYFFAFITFGDFFLQNHKISVGTVFLEVVYPNLKSLSETLIILPEIGDMS